VIPKELVKKIRYIEIYTTKAVNDVLAGQYSSIFRGHGMIFEEVREYQPGDDIRSIDWNVTARTGHPYVKRFTEERELTVFFLVDLSASGTFGSTGRAKNEVAAELCALLAFSAIKNNDKVGLVAFTDSVELFVPPAKGSSHVLRLVRDLLNFTPCRYTTNITSALDFLGKITSKRCVVFLVSDFIDSGYESQLRIISKRHDLIGIMVSDPVEFSMPDVGLVYLEDAETGQRILFDTHSPAMRRAYEQMENARRIEIREMFRSMEIDFIEVVAGSDYVKDLLKFFRIRAHRAQRGT